MLRGGLDSLVHYCSHSQIDFSIVLLCEPERQVAPCTEWSLSGGGGIVPAHIYTVTSNSADKFDKNFLVFSSL